MTPASAHDVYTAKNALDLDRHGAAFSNRDLELFGGTG